MPNWKLALVPIGLTVILLGGVLQRGPTENVFDTSGQETPQEDALFINGWNVQNHYDAKLKDTYIRFQDYLGEPVSGYNGTSQPFRFGKLTYTPSRPDDWKVEFANSGMEDMYINGLTPRLGSTPHPALRDWLQSRREDGLDIVRVVGPVISEPVCDRKSNTCKQWTAKAAFSFPDELTGENVQRLPVGLWQSHPKTRPVEKITDDSWFRFNPLSTLVGLIIVLVGVGGWMRSNSGGGSGATI